MVGAPVATNAITIMTGPKSSVIGRRKAKARARAKPKAQVAHRRRSRKEKVRKGKLLTKEKEDPRHQRIGQPRERRAAVEYEALSKETSTYQARPELSREADHHQAKQINRLAELTTKAVATKGLTANSGISPTASGTNRKSALQEINAFFIIAIKIAKSSMVTTPIQLNNSRHRQRPKPSRRRRPSQRRNLKRVLRSSAIQQYLP